MSGSVCRVLLLVILSLSNVAVRPAVAQNDPIRDRAEPRELAGGNAAASTSVEGAALKLTAGFNGVWKLGHVCPIRVEMQDSVSAEARAIRVVSVDGDGVSVVYRKDLPDRHASDLWIPVRVGKLGQPLKVEILGPADNTLAAGEIGAESSLVLPSDQPLVMAIGSSLGLEELSRTSTDRANSNFSTVVIRDSAQLPPTWYDYSACDLLVIACQDTDFLKAIGNRWEAIDRWIRCGGGCIISLGPAAATISQGEGELGRLAGLLPGPILGEGQIVNPGVLESLVATTDRIDAFSMVRLQPEKGRIELSFTDTLSRQTPWWISMAHGQGTVRVIASDLDHPAFATWEDRKLLWGKLVEPYLDRGLLAGTSIDRPVSDSSYLGYSDLIGQLRATLDVFAGVRVVSFGQTAAVLIGVLLLVGPIDYWISVRWLKRPDVSWYFAGSVLVGISIALSWFYARIRPDEVLVNTAQIVDIDTDSGAINGTLWSHVYTGSARRLDIAAQAEMPADRICLDWQGLPGRGLGGLSTQLTTDRGMPAYEINMDVDGKYLIKSVGVAHGGTKCLSGQWIGQLDLEPSFDLKELPGVDQLTGEFRNPLNVDIKDAVLFYHNWFYRLNSRIPPGSVVTISSDTIPKDIARKLNERKAVEDKVSSKKWDPADRYSIDRLLELMMFHEAATGSNYTSLSHRFQPHVDHSNLLDTDRAILVARVDRPFVSLAIHDADGTEVNARQEMERVWCRFVIAVDRAKN